MTHTVLYRKYRPQSFAEVVGQDHVVRILSNALKMERVAHAYLFSGPRGTGKTSVARIFARAVNCAKNGCGTCDNCCEFISGQTLDLVEMDAASNRGVDEVRAIREAAQLLPARAKYKVYILDEAHMLTKEAWNALLKTIEEPPSHVIFIMATTEADKIPETIQSRAQHLRFRLVDEPTLAKTITTTADKEGIALEPEAADMLALFAEGSLRDALNLLGQAQAMSGKVVTAEVLRDFFGAPSRDVITGVVSAIAARDAKRAIESAGAAFASGADPRLFIKLLIHHFRVQFLDALRAGLARQNFAEQNLGGRAENSPAGGETNPFSAKELEGILRILLETATVRFYSSWRELPIELALHRIVREI